MNFFHLLIGLKLWGSVFAACSTLFILLQRKDRIQKRGFFLALLEGSISLVLLCSLALDLVLVSAAPPKRSLYLLLRLSLVLLRCQMIVFSAQYIYMHLPWKVPGRFYLAFVAAGSYLTGAFQAAFLWRAVLSGSAPAFYSGSMPFIGIACLLFFTGSLLILLFTEKEINPAYFRALMAFLLFPMLTALVLFSTPAFFSAVDLSLSFSSIAMYVILILYRQKLIREQEEKMLEERARLARQKEEMNLLEDQLVLSQLQPEFLKETLMTISGLCDTDTEEARSGIAWFSDYLRENMDSLKKSEPVHFENHLAHIQSFLDLEGLKFGDRLRACFEFETVDFLIPTLCVQPLLENAIRYGISPAGSGTLTLRTRKRDNHVLVEIEDDGIGFDYRAEDDRKGCYPGIRAIRSRILNLSGGSLEIESSPGKGTLARIIIPARRPEDPV